MKNIIADYFGFKVPIWMQSRKSLFLFFCLDFILFLFIKTYNSQNVLDLQNISLKFLLAIAWCLISYINGKYSYFSNDEYLFRKLYKLIHSTLTSLIAIYLIDKFLIIFVPEIVPLGKNKIILLGILSFILQSLKFLIYKLKNKKIRIYLIGNEMEKKSFKAFIKGFSIYKNINFIDKLIPKKESLGKTIILIFNESIKERYINEEEINSTVQLFTPFRWSERYLNRIPVNYLNSQEVKKYNWFIDTDSFQWRLKRFGDVIFSCFLIIISLPLIALFSLIIWLEDGGPPFYSQIRTGLNGKEFQITKLRTMKQKAEKFGPVWASINDDRITKIGSFLRKTRMDELPQLASVLIGDMSLIGPRPERPEIEISLKENIPFYELREVIKPGLSGWAQVNYPYGASIRDSEMKLSFELFYIRNQSFWLDLLILIKTIKLIITMKGAKPKY